MANEAAAVGVMERLKNRVVVFREDGSEGILLREDVATRCYEVWRVSLVLERIMAFGNREHLAQMTRTRGQGETPEAWATVSEALELL